MAGWLKKTIGTIIAAVTLGSVAPNADAVERKPDSAKKAKIEITINKEEKENTKKIKESMREWQAAKLEFEKKLRKMTENKRAIYYSDYLKLQNLFNSIVYQKTKDLDKEIRGRVSTGISDEILGNLVKIREQIRQISDTKIWVYRINDERSFETEHLNAEESLKKIDSLIILLRSSRL